MISNNAASHHTFDSYCTKRVSFILPTKNRAHYLASALERCRGLKGPDDELIIIDGLSTDATKEVVGTYRDIVDIFVSELDVSSPHAHNKGYLLASGKYIKELSDDDVFYPEGIAQAIEILEQYPDIDLLLCGGTKERDGKIWNSYAPPGVNYGSSTEGVFTHDCAAGVGHFIRRSSLAKLGILYPMRTNCDRAFVLEFISKGGVVKFCRINTYHHPMHEGSITVRIQSENESDAIRLVKEYCSRLFYARWRLFQKSSFLRKKTKKLIRSLSRILLGKEYILAARKKKKENVAWDGGFS